MWVLNLFSLFSCFGAIVILIFAAIKKGDPLIGKILIILSIYVYSYASGMAMLILRYGFVIPEIQMGDVVPLNPSWSFYWISSLNLVQAWLIVDILDRYQIVTRKISLGVFLPFSLFAYLIPGVLLLINPGMANDWGNLFVLIRLCFHYSLMEYCLIAVLVRRKKWQTARWKWLSVLFLLSSVFFIPAMFLEDLLMFYRGIIIYNIFEAVGFFLLMTTGMIAGILKLSGAEKRKEKTMTLFDISRQFGLTDREVDVLRELVASPNVSYKDIAARLNISPETVKTHVSRIYRKFGVSAKQELKYKIQDIQA